MCYAFTRHDHGGSTSFLRADAEKYCNDYSSTLLTIQSDQEQAFIMRHIYGNSWLYMTLQTPGAELENFSIPRKLRFFILKFHFLTIIAFYF